MSLIYHGEARLRSQRKKDEHEMFHFVGKIQGDGDVNQRSIIIPVVLIGANAQPSYQVSPCQPHAL